MTEDGRGVLTHLYASARYRARRRRHRREDRRRSFERQLRVIGVGIGKSGTTTLAEMFRRPYRSRHEADRGHRRLAAAALTGSIEPRDMRAMLERRDRCCFDVDSTTFLGVFTAEMAEQWPDARFVLTIRECFSWLRSVSQQHVLAKSAATKTARWIDARYPVLPGDELPGDAAIVAAGGRPVRSLLRAWAIANQHVLDAAPPDRLLIVRTDELRDAATRLAAFSGARPDLVRSAHAHKSYQRRNPLVGADPDHVLRVADEECGPLMERLWGAEWRELITGVES